MEKKEKEKSRIGIKIFCLIIIFIFILYLYARYINPYSFKVNEVGVTSEELPSDYNGLKIVQFSDIHYGRTTDENKLKKIVEEINNLKPDIVIFTGDLFDSKNISDSDKDLMIDYLSKIESRLINLAVIGDYDQKYLNIYKTILEDSNFYLLDNSSKLIYDKTTTPIDLIGITDTNNIEELYNNDYFKITIMHQPDYIKNITNTNIAFAGHSLGGQFKIPFMDGIRKIDGANTYINSYYKINNTKLYISNGIGTQDISMRLFNTPSITLYRLYNY